MPFNSNKTLSNSVYFDDGMGAHIENGEVDCLSLYINGVNSSHIFDASYAYIENQISALQTTLTTCSYDSATQTFVIGNKMKCLGIFTLYISGVPYNVNTFITTTNNDIQTCFSGISTNSNAITNNTSDIQTIKSTLTNVSYNNGLAAFQIGIAGTTDCRILNTLYLYSSGVPYSVNTFVSNTNTNLSSLINKTQDISYAGGLTTIEKLSFNTFINTFSKAHFDNAINFTYNLSSNAQTQITAAQSTATAAGVAVAATDLAVAAVAADLVITNAALVVTDGNVATNTADIDTLEAKTQTYSYDVTNNVVNIASRLNANSFGGITFNGSLNQNNVNAQNDLYGNTYYHNHLRSANGAAIFAQSIDATENVGVGGTLTVGGVSTINGNLTVTNATTNLNGTTTQIGTSSTSTLNTYSSSNFYGPTTIRNNSTTSSGTISPYLNVSSIATNTNARKMQGVCIGVEQLLANEANCNIGYSFTASASALNYGYLGLNVGSFNVYECLRWSPSKVTISNGNLEVTNNANILGNSTISGTLTCNTIQNNNLNPLAITATGANNNVVITSAANTNLFGAIVKLNSDQIQIGSNQAAAVGNTILLGSISSQTTTSVPYLFKTNSITGYNAATALSLNNGVINIGYNEGVAAGNTVNIGAVTSNTQVYINGQLTLNYGLGNINVNSVLSQFV